MLAFILMVLDYIFGGGLRRFFCASCLLHLQFTKYSFNFLFNDRLSVHVMHAATSVQLELAGLFQCSFPGFGRCCSKHFIVIKWSLTDGSWCHLSHVWFDGITFI